MALTETVLLNEKIYTILASISSHLISLSMQFRLFNIFSSIFLFIRISNFYLRFLKRKKKNDSVFLES